MNSSSILFEQVEIPSFVKNCKYSESQTKLALFKLAIGTSLFSGEQHTFYLNQTTCKLSDMGEAKIIKTKHE